MKYTQLFLLFTLAILTRLEIPAQSRVEAAPMSPEARTKAEQKNLKVILSNIEKFNRGDASGAAEDWSEEITNHGEKVGRNGIRAVMEDIFRTFPDAKLEIRNVVVVGESVVVRAVFKGTHRGKGVLPVNGGMLVGVEPTGKSFAVSHIHWFHLRDSKIIAHYASRDDIEMMRQLGLSPEIGAKPPISGNQSSNP